MIGALAAIFDAWVRCRGVKGWSDHFVLPEGGRSALGISRSRSVRAQGHTVKNKLDDYPDRTGLPLSVRFYLDFHPVGQLSGSIWTVKKK